MLHLSNPEIFGLPVDGALRQGYVRLQSDSGRFTGAVYFSDSLGQRFGSALRLMETGPTTTYFAQVAQNDVFYTGLATVNPNLLPAVVSVVNLCEGEWPRSYRNEVKSSGRLLAALVVNSC